MQQHIGVSCLNMNVLALYWPSSPGQPYSANSQGGASGWSHAQLGLCGLVICAVVDVSVELITNPTVATNATITNRLITIRMGTP